MPDLTVRRLEGLFHEPHNEPEQDAVLDDIVAWLDAHLSPVPA
jgi:alpha-beta hydrolase superfamily lysophospholipase